MDKGESVLRYARQPLVAPVTSAISPSTMNVPAALANLSFDEFETHLRFEEKYPEMKGLKDIAAKRAFVVARREELRIEIANLEAELNDDARTKRLAYLTKNVERFRELEIWVKSGLKIERPDCVSFRQLRKDVATGQTIYLDKDTDAKVPAHDFEKEVFRFAEILMIEHDWAGAMQGADLADAVVKLPYEVCAFEFKFSGHAVVVLATQLEFDIAFSPAILLGDTWVLTGFVALASGYGEDDNGWIKFFNILGAQIRAVCIALDAEVAKSDAIREPYMSSHGRNAHRPLKPYHVVSLAHRGPRPLPASGMETGRRVRLHFRRGHWRHFVDHKTWIRWMLVGDPDLGFVDKHYKL